MKKTVLFFFSVALQAALLAQAPAASSIETAEGPLTIQPVYHGALAMKWNGIVIYVDPYHGAKGFEGLGDADIILITDVHPDHLDLETLRGLNTAKASLVAPKAVYEQLPDDLKKICVALANGKGTTLRGIPILALPMYNLPELPDAMHTKGRGNGYLLQIGGKQVYVSGDTEDTPEMRGLKNVDVAFVCMNLPYTMDVNQAADAVLDFKPRIVYPYHYRGQNGLSDVKAFKALVDAGKAGIEVRLANWYPEP